MIFFILFCYTLGWFVVKILSEPLTADNIRSMYIKVPQLTLSNVVKDIPVSAASSSLSCVNNLLATAIPKKGLTTEESATIRSYTAECGIYKPLNAALRTHELTNIQPWFAYLKLFHHALMKITPKTGSYCRGISGDYHKDYPVNSIVVWWGISSISKSDTVCFNFMNSITSSTGGIFFKVISLSAREVEDFSAYPLEQESILLPATKFKVLNNKPSATFKGVYDITLEELDDIPTVMHTSKSTIKISTSTLMKATTTTIALTTKTSSTSTKIIPVPTKTSSTPTNIPKTTTKMMKTSVKLTSKEVFLTNSRPVNIYKSKPQTSFANALIEKRNSNRQILMIAIGFINTLTISIGLMF